MSIKWRKISDMDVDPATGPFGNTGLRIHNMTNANQPTAAAALNGLLVYDTTNNQLECIVNGSWATLATSATQGTLDQAYDSGGAGNGRTITVDSGDVQLNLNAAGSSLLCDVAAAVTVTDALIFTTTDAAGLITDAIDCTDGGITNALNVGAAAITGTTGNITYTNFSFTGGTGALACQSIDRATAGGLTIGGAIATSVAITPNTTIAGTLGVTGAATLSAGVTQSGGNTSLTPTATTGDGLLVDGTSVTTGNVVRIEYDATNSGAGFGALEVTEDGVAQFTIGEDGATVIAGTASGTDALTLTAGDILLTAGNIDMTNGDFTMAGGSFDITGDAGADVFDIVGVAAGAVFDINLAAASNLAGGYIDIDGSTGSGPVIAVNMSGTYTGTFLALDTTTAVGASAIVLTGAGTRTVALVSVTDTPSTLATFDLNVTPAAAQAGANVFDIDIAGTGSANVIDIDFAAAYTGDALNIDMTNAVAANALDITGAGTRTVPLITITDVPTTGAPTLDMNITAGAAVQSGIDIDVAGTAASDVFSVDCSAAFTGDIFNITMTNVAATGQALVIDGGQTAASVNIVDISTSSAMAGGTGRLMTLTSSGNLAAATEGAVLNVAETGAAQATSYAVQIDSTNNEALLVDTGLSRFDEAVTFKASNRNTIRPNYVQAGGANNAITATLTDSDAANVALTDGLVVLIDLNTLTLQAGANTFNLNAGGALSIVSKYNPATNIATAYAANGFIELVYNSTSNVWMDLSQ